MKISYRTIILIAWFVHLEQITKVPTKKLFIKVYSNFFVKNNLKLAKMSVLKKIHF